MGRDLLRDPMGGDQEFVGSVDRYCKAGIWPRGSCEFSTAERTGPPTHRGSSAPARTIFSKLARVSRTVRPAVHPNNTRVRSLQRRSTQPQFQWKRLLSSNIIADKRCRNVPPATSIAPNSRRGRGTSWIVVTREARTGLIFVKTGRDD